MILPDVNTLVYAFRGEAPRHAEYARWLTEVVGGAEELALHDSVLSGVVRIVTNPRIFADPAPTSVALSFVQRLVEARRATWLSSGDDVWRRLDDWAAQDAGLRGNAVPDALLAALAVTHGARLATADRGFARYPGLRWFTLIGTS
ncbi:TA system VapC family ribonuclease toxin [uncultured Pseudokineococcus sp.]|uniref:TA system VapC family ribonuclease toxin n=1 Tax=uncultured Pseudokineococcus sp. TaxID=1642928 RepID=UPI0026022199|nr:TA system VapC family ribonuclease toxin [uncultured Pseudokineococcus sp.]